jgi:Cytochrome b(C-terminal)/b6/petD
MVDGLKDLVNYFSAPKWSFSIVTVVFVASLFWRRLWTKAGGLAMLVGVTLYLAVSMLDENFRLVVAKPDNVPIVMMIYFVGFFLWLSMHKAYENDALTANGEPTFEKTEASDKIFTWPDLVFSELICMVLLTVALTVWSILLKAPLEEPANTAVAPNPSKAPWYFLGLQEMLVYFDPWMAGVVLPSLIIVGLCAIPYMDTNTKGNGYFTFKERRTEIVVFLYGFVVLWCYLIAVGTFMRGPNWNFFGLYEFWDISKVEPLVNVDLSEYIFIKWLGVGLPSFWLLRELPGIVLLLAYLVALPVLLTKLKFFKRYYDEMGTSRYYVGMTLFLVMMLLPIKMYLRWAFNLKYLVHIQEYFLNV